MIRAVPCRVVLACGCPGVQEYAVFKAVLGGLWCLVAVLVVSTATGLSPPQDLMLPPTAVCSTLLVCACDSLASLPHVAAVRFALQRLACVYS